MKKLYTLFTILLFVALLTGCHSQNNISRGNNMNHLEIGKTYQVGNSGNSFVKLVDSTRFVYFSSNKINYTQEQLDKFNRESETSVIYYPEIEFTEGNYSRKGDSYVLKPIKSIKITFKDAKSVKDKIYSESMTEDESKSSSPIRLKKSDGKYVKVQTNGEFSLSKASKKLPNSIDDFLAQYKYEPEELE